MFRQQKRTGTYLTPIHFPDLHTITGVFIALYKCQITSSIGAIDYKQLMQAKNKGKLKEICYKMCCTFCFYNINICIKI